MVLRCRMDLGGHSRVRRCRAQAAATKGFCAALGGAGSYYACRGLWLDHGAAPGKPSCGDVCTQACKDAAWQRQGMSSMQRQRHMHAGSARPAGQQGRSQAPAHVQRTCPARSSCPAPASALPPGPGGAPPSRPWPSAAPPPHAALPAGCPAAPVSVAGTRGRHEAGGAAHGKQGTVTECT